MTEYAVADESSNQPTIIDARGLKCPQPVLRARAALAELHSGDVVELLATDSHAEIDVTVFCDRTGHLLRSITQDESGVLHLLIEHA